MIRIRPLGFPRGRMGFTKTPRFKGSGRMDGKIPTALGRVGIEGGFLQRLALVGLPLPAVLELMIARLDAEVPQFLREPARRHLVPRPAPLRPGARVHRIQLVENGIRRQPCRIPVLGEDGVQVADQRLAGALAVGIASRRNEDARLPCSTARGAPVTAGHVRDRE